MEVDRFCRGCGTPRPGFAAFCGQCGRPFQANIVRAVPAAYFVVQPMPIPTSPYAGFGERTAAYLIDSLLLGIGNLILGALFANSPGALLAAVILLPAIYFIAGWTSSNGQTIGMRALNLKLQRTNGDHVGFAHALGRYLWLGLSMLCLGFGVFSVGWDERKQGWHDKFADTFVLRAQ